jgi:thiol-disulfide isomerase/thioredoxin
MLIKINFKILNLLLIISSIKNLNYVNLDIENFDSEVNISKEIWLIEFFSEKCGTCKEFYPIWIELTKNINYLKIGRVNIDNEKGLNIASRLNALENGIPCVKLNYGKDKIEDIMVGTEDPLPNANMLKDRIDRVLNKKGKLKNGKYFVTEDL